MEKRVGITVEASVDVKANVDKARASIAGLIGGNAPVPAGPTGTVGSGPQPSGTPAPMTEGQRLWMENAAWRMSQSLSAGAAGGHSSESQYRKLLERLSRADFYAEGSGNRDLIDSLNKLREQVEKDRAARGAGSGAGGGAGQPPPPPAPPGGAPPPPGAGAGLPTWAQKGLGWLENRGGAAAGLAGLLGGAGRLALGPVGLGLGALGAANGAFNLVANDVREKNAPARNEVLGMADLARQYGSEQDMFFKLRDKGGASARQFREMGYNATDAGHVAALYDRPGGMMNDTTSILQFSRSMGVDESKTASIARTLGIAGVGGLKGGSIDDGLRVTKLAVTEGIKAGIAGSDTMNSLVGFAQKNYSEGRSTTAASLASMSQLVARLNNTGSAVLRGQAGADAAQSVLGGIGNAEPGLEFLMLKAIGAPSGKAVGLRGKEAATYDTMRSQNPLEAGRFLLSRIQGGNNPALREQATKAIDSAAGGNTALQMKMYESAFGLSPEQSLAMISSGGVGSLFKSNPADLQKRLVGSKLTDDVQGGNRMARDTLQLRGDERDRDMMKSLGYLSALGGIEGTLNNVYNEVAKIRAKMTNLGATYGNSGQSQRGNMADGYRDGLGGALPAPGTGFGAGGGQIGTNTLRGSTLLRTQAAIAAHESRNGTMDSMNSGDHVGLFQMGGGLMTGPDSWAKKYLGRDVAQTADQGRQWMIDNPQEANQVATRRIADIQSHLASTFKKAGLPLTDNQLANMTGVMWHRNGGGNLDNAASFDMFRDKPGGSLQANYQKLSRKGGPDGVSDYDYYRKMQDQYSDVNLKPAATGLPPNNGAGPPMPAYRPVPVGSGTDAFSGQADRAVMARISGDKGGSVTQGFGINTGMRNAQGKLMYGPGGHDGVDLGLSGGEGSPVYAPFGGTYSRTQTAEQGNQARIMGDSGYTLLFSHLAEQELRGLKNGQKVGPNTLIGHEGRSGTNVTGAHLHFGVLDPSGVPVAPSRLMESWEKARATGSKGFYGGGYTGDGQRGGVAGVVHHGEFVLDAVTTSRYRPMLDAMRSGSLPGGGNVSVDVSGTVKVDAQLLSQAGRAGAQALTTQYRTALGQIVAHDLPSHTGPR